MDQKTFDEAYGMAISLNKRIGALAKYLKQSKPTKPKRPRPRPRPATSD